MKRVAFCKVILTATLFVGLIGCTEDHPGENKAVIDSIRNADSIAAQFRLESLFQFQTEADLINRYSKENVKLDTIWGYEGYFTMGTVLKTELASHIEITWKNDSLKTGIISVTQVSDSDWYADSLARSEWKSSTGVYVGMSIDELQRINGRPFTFSGFGWDYAGGVISWNGGTLEGKGIAVQLSEGPVVPSRKVTDEERNAVLGDVEVQSDNPVLSVYAPRVWSISVAKVQ